ncbi:MAG: undecaprenyl-diphosphate phosphatase [Coriobacteriia bacterium]|nr:undecaprenyl-diphosphate phosphatase [Coriobacteriia bacterium]
MDFAVEMIKAVLFGVVEGISEWLPISSTGHMMLLNQFLPLNVSPEFYATFLVVIQLGAILAVLLLFFHKLNPFSPKKDAAQKKETWGIWAKVVVGSIPAAVVGFALDDFFEEHIANSDFGYIVVSAALIVYGVIFIVMEAVNRKRIAAATAGEDRAYAGKHARTDRPVTSEQDESDGDASEAIAKVTTFEELSFARAFGIGCFQALAIVPGTSRSGSIIIGSMLLGCSRTIATEFAFFLAIPIMAGWSLIKFIKHGFAYTGLEWAVLGVGLVVAFLVSVVAIKFLVGFVKKNDFTAFGVYRIVIAVVVLVIFGVMV